LDKNLFEEQFQLSLTMNVRLILMSFRDTIQLNILIKWSYYINAYMYIFYVRLLYQIYIYRNNLVTNLYQIIL